MNTRIEEWQEFAPTVEAHIESYANAQYGEKGTDQLTNFKPEDIKVQIQRYANRIGSGARGKEEALRDCLKMAHYSCVLWAKYQEEDSK